MNSLFITIFTGLTVVAALLGGGVLMWWINKPRIRLLKAEGTGWCYVYQGGEIKAVRIDVAVTLLNVGREPSNISTELEVDFGGSIGKDVISSEYQILLDGSGKQQRSSLSFDYQLGAKQPPELKTLRGTIRLRPWGNRRLFFWKSKLQREVEIPYDNTISPAPTIASI